MIYKFKTEQTRIGFDFDIEFEPNQKIYCVIGKNGIGKTQLLENMAKSIFYRHSIFNIENKNLNFSGIFLQKIINEKLKEESLSLPL